MDKNLALAVLRGRKTDGVPCYFSSCQAVLPINHMETPKNRVKGLDGFGVHQTPTASANGMCTPTPGYGPVLTDIHKWKEQVSFPDYDRVNWAEAYEQEKMLFGWDPDRYVQDVFSPTGLFERLHFLMGFEQAMCVIALEPEATYELVEAIADSKISYLNRIADRYRPDFFTLLDDYAFSEGLFFSLETFRSIFKPHLKRIVDAAHGKGMLYKQHCCGKMESLLDDLMEIGVDALDPLQPINNIPAMLEKTKGSVGLVGGLDVQQVIDRDGVSNVEIRHEVRRCIESYGVGGGYMLYGATIDLYDPRSRKPGGKIWTIIDECRAHENHRIFV